MRISTTTIGPNGPNPDSKTYDIVSGEHETPAANRDWSAVKWALGQALDDLATAAPSDAEALIFAVSLDGCGVHKVALELDPDPPPRRKTVRLELLPRRRLTVQMVKREDGHNV